MSIFSPICLLWLADMALLAGFGPIGRNVPLSAALYAAAFVFLIAAIRRFPGGLKPATSFLLIFGMGLFGRLAMLYYPPGPDIFRYIWEGAIQAHGVNPYATAPDSPALAALAQGELGPIWQRVGHKTLTAIYPPGAMLLFRMLAAIGPTPLVFKTAFILLDLGTMAALAGILRMRGLPPSHLLFYAANPLVVLFLCGEGHVDVLQAFWLSWACFFALRARCAFAGLALGMGVMAKYLVFAAAPFLFTACRRRGFAAALIPLALFAPFMGAEGGLFASLTRFAADMQYNAFVADGLGRVFPGWWLPASALLLSACCTWIWLSEDDPLHGVYLGLGCVLLLLPTVHPWYLALVAPLLCLYPSTAWLWLQAAALFTFPVFGVEHRTGVFAENPWAVWPQYLPFLALAVLGLFRANRIGRGPFTAPVATISVVVPTLDEAPVIRRCLDALNAGGPVLEVIVADGGSSDRTVEIARAAGARVVESGRGRGRQMRSGAELARGDVILFLHADSALAPGTVDRVVQRLQRSPWAPGGCIGMRFEEGGWVQRAVAGLNNLRAFATGIGFGDQAQFVRRSALDAIGGLPPLMLMEDVELSLRLKRVGRPVYLSRGVAVSGRRWRNGQAVRRVGLILRLFGRFLVERRVWGVRDDAERYYRTYYGAP